MVCKPLILASESPRRALILESLHIPFIKIVPSIDETIFDHLEPADRVTALAATKARQGKILWEKIKKNESKQLPRFVLGADTLVALKESNGWRTIGKPSDKRDAAAMLRKEQGKSQMVFSGLCVLDMEIDKPYPALSISSVQFSAMSELEIESYLEFNEWQGAAGAYQIQGAGSYFIERIDGSYSGIMGLPIHELYGILQASGYFPYNYLR